MQESAKYDELKRAQEEESKLFQKEIQRYQTENDKELRKLEEDYQQKERRMEQCLLMLLHQTCPSIAQSHNLLQI